MVALRLDGLLDIPSFTAPLPQHTILGAPLMTPLSGELLKTRGYAGRCNTFDLAILLM